MQYFSVLFFRSPVSGYGVLCSTRTIPNNSLQALDVLAEDTHYKYFIILLIPTTSYFVIANWVGWQYYRNS